MKLTIETNPEIVIEIEQIERIGKETTPIKRVPEANPESPSPVTKRRKTGGRKSRIDPDVLQAIKNDIRDMIPFSEISRNHSVDVSSLYNIKHRMRSNGELPDDVI